MTIYHLVCPVCGKHFDAMRSHRVFCSKSCAYKDYYNRKKSILGRRFCANCWKEYQPKCKDGIYCSGRCRDAAWHKRNKINKEKENEK